MPKTGEWQLPESFSRKVETAFDKFGQLCVGIDPHAELLEEAGISDSADGLRTFSMQLLDQLEGVVGIIKPQVAFFERFGSAGFAVLEEVCSDASKRGFLVIADAKRGDIGSTMSAYAEAWLGKASPLVVDALTVSPYLGTGALSSALALASERGKGLFVLCATSNAEGKELQQAISGGTTVAANVAAEVASLNKITAQGKTKFGTAGLVIGATVNLKDYGIDDLNRTDNCKSLILAPGFGAQGASLAAARAIFGSNADNVIYTISRSALRNGFDQVSQSVTADKNELALALGA
jgi:orotidine-5'-phosphate decarboxylase